ncbi:MAG TPA: UDP-N-acetylglucosamine 2-epimerase (non-hydrolyzing) [Candidatus Saccharimonadales bacterium]|nr:UDP-N-acetylglucosamine 2-epimerase (non-hydrolyzing) [Candidatus Saccharimonadales bacterium]
MKVLTILGTRPEIIRLNIILKKLDKLCDHVIVHTGQNYDYSLDGVFLEQLSVRKANYYLGAKGSFSEQIATILSGLEKILLKEKPDRFLVLGDTNSSLGAIVAKRFGIPVYHMEAGNRCYDDRVPEEVNRRIIDHSSDILMPYTYRSRENLLREGIPGYRIFITGNPIKEVLDTYQKEIDENRIFTRFDIQEKKYFLATLHREENVDLVDRLRNFVKAFETLVTEYKIPLIWSVHPRTKKRLEENNITITNPLIHCSEPFGFFEFVKLEKNSFCVLSDSGTVQEECAIFQVPTVTVRDTTERPETIDVGSNILSGGDNEAIIRCVKTVTGSKRTWQAPQEYLVENVSDIVINILFSHPFYKYSRP